MIPDVLRMALLVLVRNPGRTMLTTVGLAIGVAAFIAMVSFARGARSSVDSQFSKLGRHVLRVKLDHGLLGEQPRPLTEADVAALRQSATTLGPIIPYAIRGGDLSYRGRHHHALLRGTVPEFASVRPTDLSAGGFFDAIDMERRSPVCLLGPEVVDTLFAGQDALGETVDIEGKMPCRVIGVMARRGSAVSGDDLDNRVILPLSAFKAYLGLPRGIWLIETVARQPRLMAAARDEIERILRRHRAIAPDQDDDFVVHTPDEIAQVAQDIGGILTGLLAGIAAVSLLVGGIGIMNIQLVSVAERTHEIGVRSALGASPFQIMRQFVIEALILASLGSAAGVALGIGISMLVAKVMAWQPSEMLVIALGSALFGLAVGTLFGSIPARQAARLDPIEALRRE
ncbi:MAG: ABC transporter permease [Myxococcales bacterium]|nr:ABC transporter permease [Myxococcales bacterium]